MVEALVLTLCLAAFVPSVSKSFYRVFAILISDHVLHEALICTEETRKPTECQTQALQRLNDSLPWKNEIQLFIHMGERQYRGDLILAFNEQNIHRKRITIDMDQW